MLCSTIIPTINRPSLERAIKSVLEQDINPEQQEIIVVNDSGKSLPDYDWLKSRQIKILDTHRCERSVACNVGAAIATGKYIKILHDDDYLLPNALKVLLELAESSGSAWVYGALNRVDDSGKVMSINRPEVKGILFGHTVAGDCIHLGASLISREMFFRVGCFDPRIKTAEDRDLMLRISMVSSFECTDQIVANIRIGATSQTTTDWGMKTPENRLIRERALNEHAALTHILNSVKGDVQLRGRCFRAYLISAVLNFRDACFFIGLSRLLHAALLTGFYIFQPDLWRGLLMRSHWHTYEKYREEQHYM